METIDLQTCLIPPRQKTTCVGQISPGEVPDDSTVSCQPHPVHVKRTWMRETGKGSRTEEEEEEEEEEGLRSIAASVEVSEAFRNSQGLQGGWLQG